MKRTRDQKLEGAYFAVRSNGGQVQYWVVIPVAEGWVAAQRVVAQEGGMVVAELRVFPLERPSGKAGEWSGAASTVPRGGVSTPLLRHIPAGRHAVASVVTDWVETMLRQNSERADGALIWPPRLRARAHRVMRDLGLHGREPRPADQPIGVRGRPGRNPTRDREFYEGIAKDYRRWSKDAPARKIADKWKVPPATARTWIWKARHTLGLLPPTERGRGSVFMNATRQRRTRKGKGR